MKKRIIHIVLGKANPERQNGVNKVVNSILHYQVANGFRAELWGITFSNEENWPARNYSTRLFADSKNKFKLDPQLVKALHQLDPNDTIVHLHGVFLPQMYRISRELKAYNIPYFFTPHGGYNIKALEKSKWRKRFYIQFFEKQLVNDAHGVQLLGKSENDGFQKYFKNKTFLIPNGQEPMDVQPLEEKEAQLIIGFIGRIDIHTKGLDYLLEGLRKAKQYLNIQLEIVGAGGETDALKTMVEAYELEDWVTFKGALFGNDKFEALRQWDALCLVSRNEGLPGVVLEAASVGVPAIVSEATNMGDYIRQYKSGWVLKEHSGKGILERINDLNESKIQNRLSNYQYAAQAMVAEAFDWNRIVKQLVKAYE